MRAAQTNREITSSGVKAQASFGISLRNQAHLMTILRDTLYSDKVLAVLREYSANAWDSHRTSGCADRPIRIKMPTSMDLTLSIRDYGAGLSEEEVFTVFTQYGESTKRDSDDAVGMLGIGSKSAFAYSDSFTVTSWNGGMKSVYVAVLDESDVGVINKLHEEPCGDETGLEVQVPIRPEDVREFHDKAQGLFPYFRPLPDINIQLPSVSLDTRKHGCFNREAREWVGVMGCIPYRINVRQVQKDLEQAGIWEIINRSKGFIYFEIGEVQINASREELKYSTYTRQALVRKFQGLVDEYVESVVETLQSNDKSPWEKRVEAVYITHDMKISLPDRFKEWRDNYVLLLGPEEPEPETKDGEEVEGEVPEKSRRPKTFTLVSNGKVTWSLPVHRGTRLVWKDDDRPLKGFRLGFRDILVRPRLDATPDEVRKELELVLETSKATGVPMVNLSTFSWFEPSEGSKVKPATNKKHLVNSFKLVDGTLVECDPYSRNWQVAQWEPSDNDVFVVISKFRLLDGSSKIYSQINRDREIIKWLGGTFPTIYGHKSTAKRPVDEALCKGTPYRDWRVKYMLSLLKPGLRKEIELWRTDQKFKTFQTPRHKDLRSNAQKIGEFLTEQLGKDHALTRMIMKIYEARIFVSKSTPTYLSNIEDLASRLGSEVSNKVEEETKALMKAYPLMGAVGGLRALAYKEYLGEWVDYVKLVDSQEGKEA